MRPPVQRLVPGSCLLGTAALSQIPFATYCRMTFEHWYKHSIYFSPSLGTGLFVSVSASHVFPACRSLEFSHPLLDFAVVITCPLFQSSVLESGNTEMHRKVLLECQLCEDRQTLLLLSFGLTGSTIPRMVPGTQEMLIRKCILNE